MGKGARNRAQRSRSDLFNRRYLAKARWIRAQRARREREAAEAAEKGE